ncbi:toll-like receptor 13 [Pecten maximus]|uniref:toll-like receptor 13 n=1 Tax=Pecten maximus TaxID=6579 RepID=UPI001458D67B|nr:toll-like receptor 13 [Pecten maximus]
MWKAKVILLTGLCLVSFTLGTSVCPALCKCHGTEASCRKHYKHLFYIPALPEATKTLYFTGNWLPHVDKETFKNISYLRLEELIFGGNHIKNISKDAFELFPYLRFLDLSGNQIPMDILHDAFYGLRNSKLYKMNLEDMALTDVPVNMFEHLQATPIDGFGLSKNNFTMLNGNVFAKLNVTHLGINNNYIKSINWTGLHNIQVLRLRWNKLPDVPDFCSQRNISIVPNLLVLDLGSNKLFEIQPHQFRGHCLPKLTNLTLDQNYFRVVPNDTFRDLPSLRRLSLTWIRQNDLLFEPLAFRSDSMELLYIANHIDHFVEMNDLPNLFRFCPALKVLDMTKIRLTTPGGRLLQAMLSPLTNLTKLVLQNTYIYNVPPDLFHKMTKLENLNLMGCNIQGWEPRTFQNATSIRRIYLNRNKITLVNQTSFPAEVLDSLSFMNLQGNPFACDCDAYWFRQWVRQHRSILAYFPKGYQCATPVAWKNKLLVDYEPSYRDCHPISVFIILGASLGSVLVLITIVSSLLYHYRWHIRHYIYIMRAKRGYERIPEGEDFAFDAFVAYNTEDRVFVISKLIPYLENEQNLKLCVHDRDFKAGMLIVDNIQETIGRSRKVILVLSNAFAKSQWCKFELALAQIRSIEEGGNMVIIIMLEDIEARYMTNSLHVLLKSTTYIPWAQNQEGQELFWKRLVDSFQGQGD